MLNPGRRRRRRKGRRSRARRTHRRYRARRYRRNPGGFLVDFAKRALPVLGAFYANRLLVSKVGPMLPMVSSLGSLQGPALSVAGLLGWNLATKKVGALAKHRTEILTGAMLQTLDAVIRAFAPASVQSMIGMSDYFAMSDYIATGAIPINDQITMSDYLAVGSDGVQEELGIEEELGVEEELGSDLLGGVAQSSMLKQVPQQRFLAPVPARSFTRQIPDAGTSYDNPGQLYTGIFAGKTFGT